MSIKPEATWAASPTTTRGQPTPLSSDSKGERIAYASNKSIFVRSIDDPAISIQYTAHTSQTTVARFSPSGFYIASGDVSGMVRVWDCVGEGATKGEYPIIAGRINDIAWDGDSQRIIAVGDGRERFGHCITADSGNTVGEISGHSSQINCVDVRKQRPLRAATGSDDTSLVFLHGAPFKFNTSVRGKHDKFIFGTAFSPDGSTLVSVGSDRRIWLYDGKSGEPRSQIGEGEHRGSIFGVSWAKDSRRFVTASADQTVKIWDAEAGKCVQSWRMGEESVVSIPNQQVGVTWPAGRSDGIVISVDLEGNLNYLKEGNDKPVKVVRGHQKAITATCFATKDDTLWTGSYEGRVRAWDASSGQAQEIDGETHSNYVSGLAFSPEEGRIYSIGWDDTLRTINAEAKSFAGASIKTKGQPKGLAACTSGSIGAQVLVASPGLITAYENGKEVASHPISFSPTCLAANDDLLAVGAEDRIIRIYNVSPKFSLIAELKDANSPTSALAFSGPSSSPQCLAAGLANGKIFVWSIKDWSLVTNRWSAHTARVTSISWDPSGGERAVSGAFDTNVHVWSLKDPGRRVKAANAHKDGVGGVVWLDGEKILSCGADATVKVWKVEGVA
ncbi:WD40 repeat-like protein [Elasticomyces elasticus]|nr:WD40 repeat-like protein [Elasticomyces elasticus]